MLLHYDPHHNQSMIKMSSDDLRLSESLRSNIDASLNTGSVNVEDLIQRVKLDSSTPNYPFVVSNRKRQSLVFENILNIKQNSILEKAFEEFQV